MGRAWLHLGTVGGWTAALLVLIVTSGSAQEGGGLLDRPARLDVEEVTLEAALRELQRTSGVAMAFSPDLLPAGSGFTCECAEVTVREALNRLLLNTELQYVAGRRQVLIGRRGDNGAPFPSTLVGRVVERGSQRPIPSADVLLLSVERRAVSGGDGRFVLEDLHQGALRLRVSAFGYRPAEVPVTVAEAAVRGIVVELEREPIPLADIVIAPGSYGALEVSPAMMGSAITRDDIEAIPQMGDDVFRTLRRLPGVATDDVSTQLNVRGGTGRDMLVRLDGLELYEPYHLKDMDGVFGIVDVQSLGGIDLITGGFPVDFGDKWGGIFDMRTRNPPAEGTRTTLGMSMSSLSFISQGTFAEGRGQWLTSLRRGFLQYVLAVTGVDDDLRPAYWDLLGRGQYLLSENHLVSLSVLHAGDDVLWRDDETQLRVDSDWTNTYAWAGWDASFTPWLHANTVVSVGRVSRDRGGRGGNPDDGVFTPLSSYISDVAEISFGGIKQDWQLDLSQNALFKAGFDLKTSSGEYDYFSSATYRDADGEGRIVMPTKTTSVELEPVGDEVGVYGALRGRATGALTWEAGLRYDYQSHTGDEDLAPRFLLRWDIDGSTIFRGTLGRYFQSQGLHELNVTDGEQTYSPSELAEQLALGVQRQLPGNMTGRVEAYYRRVEDHRPVYINLAREIDPLMEVSGDRRRVDPARGRARGLEFLVDGEGAGPWSWSASYSLAQSEFEVDGDWVPRVYDQRHSFNARVSYETRRWQLSGSWHYHTGWPVTSQFLDVVLREGPDGEPRAVFLRRGFGPLNAERLPAYHRMDVRLTRSFELRGGELELYLDIFNLYDQENLRGYSYSLVGNPTGRYTTRRGTGEEMMPVLPTVGFRWVF